jgi:hypothetical protein
MYVGREGNEEGRDFQLGPPEHDEECRLQEIRNGEEGGYQLLESQGTKKRKRGVAEGSVK